MRFADLVQGLKVRIDPALSSLEIKGIAYNSQQVKNNFLFVAIRGFSKDGHQYIPDAIENGASLIALESLRLVHKSPLQVRDHLLVLHNKKVPFVKFRDNRVLLSRVSANFYNHPSCELNVIGITGTNGKTTTSFLIEKILSDNRFKTGIIGTIHYRVGRKVLPAPNTTPESLDLHSLLNEMVKKDVRFVIMEVSSHSLSLHRVDDVHFDTVIFTNLTEDHFDFHKNYSRYFKAKKKIFELLLASEKKVKTAFINKDDGYGRKLLKTYGKQKKFILTSYGIQGASDLMGENISISLNRTEFDFHYKGRTYRVRSKFIGKHNVYNILSAIGCGLIENIKIDRILRSVARLEKVEGRLEILKIKDYYVGIDFAHTEDALKNVLLAVKELKPERIITIFGCGGNRDRRKRPLMARVASENSDIVIITSDNPRLEAPQAILKEVERGLRSRIEYYKMEDRFEAIKKGLSFARRNDFILIAGKGHEDYQIIGNTKYHFNDKEVVMELSGH